MFIACRPFITMTLSRVHVLFAFLMRQTVAPVAVGDLQCAGEGWLFISAFLLRVPTYWKGLRRRRRAVVEL